MFSIAAVGSAHDRYLLREYYKEGQSARVEWVGSGAAALGLVGEALPHWLNRLMKGFSPDGRPLVQNAGAESRQIGWDVTASDPKSASTVRVMLPGELLPRRFDRARRGAILKTVEYLEQSAAFTRRGRGGHAIEPVGLVIARVSHFVSRSLEPAFHDHLLILNIGVRRDGSTGAILSKPLYEHKMAAGAIYRAELAANLERELKVVCERDGDSFKIVGVPAELCRHFSTRRREIDEWLDRSGLRSAAAASVAALRTRKAKRKLPPNADLLSAWRATAQAFGFDVQEVLGRSQRQLAESAPAKKIREAAEEFVRNGREGFRARDLVRAVAVAAQGTGYGAEHVLAAAHEVLARGRTVREEHADADVQFVALPAERDVGRLRKEVGLLSVRRSHGVSRLTIAKVLNRYAKPRSPLIEELRHHRTQLGRAIARKPTTPLVRSKLQREAGLTLSDEQKLAVLRLTREEGRDLRILDSGSDAERRLTLRAAAEIWKAGGYRVLGVTNAGGGRHALEQQTGIKAYSAERLLRMLRSGVSSRVAHDATQLARAAAKKPTFKPFRLSRRSVLVIDTRDLDDRDLQKLLRTARKAGAMVVTAGKAHYLQTISRDYELREKARVGETASLEAQRTPRARRVDEEVRYAEAR